MGIQLYPPERGIGPEQTLQLLSKVQSLFTQKEIYLGEKNDLLAIILFIIILSFCLRKIIIQN